MKFVVWAVCGVTFVAAVVVDWRAALLMFIACWADRILASFRRGERAASGIDARSGETEGLDPQGESPVPERQTPKA